MKLLQLLIVTLALMVTVTVARASGNADDGHAHENAPVNDNRPRTTETQRTKRIELSMEYPVMVAGEPGRFIIRLTILDGLQPVREGRVRLTFVALDGHEQTFSEDRLVREGEFAPTIVLRDPGPHQFILSYESSEITDSFVIDGFKVYADSKYIPQEHETKGNQITFLKAQQQGVPFATAQAQIREVKRSVWAVGHVLPSPDSYVEVISPVDGVVQVKNGNKPALPGTSVLRGDVVVVIKPSLQGDGWPSAHLAYKQSKRDYERAQRLKAQEAISDRDFEAIENEYQTLKAGFEALAGGGGTNALELHAPINGRIIEWNLRPGQRVSTGDKLMAIADPRTVWLRVNVYVQDYRNLGTPVGALIKTNDEGIVVGEESMRLLSSGGALDPDTRTVPVLLQVSNEAGLLRINETVPLELYTSEGISSPAVPFGSIYDDDGLDVVFVQTGEESFEKRVVQKGPRHENWVAILDGLAGGERVVTQGGYHIKLASTSKEIGHGHAH